jgi:glycogen debranching enzyme
LMTEQLFSGWGIRTVGAAESRYNPMSYHNGSVWPHDNALIGLGFSLYGFQRQSCEILNALFEVSRDVELQRLPELFCGFHERPGTNGPTLYPVACAPQAWAAGAVFLLLRACLGMSLRALERQICFNHPLLPQNVDHVQIENLRLVDATVDLLIHRHDEGVAVEVLRRRGEIEILKSL